MSIYITEADDINLVFLGLVEKLDPILNADLIVSATVDCGRGGRWKGVVREIDFKVGDACLVYLPDAIVPKDAVGMGFMKNSNWRVRMQRFRGAPSEVVIAKTELDHEIGTDLTKEMRVRKYFKPVTKDMHCPILGGFPQMLPRTDEPHYQSKPALVNMLHGKPYYITQKMDGTSCTAYKHKGHFGVCNRNNELAYKEDVAYWIVADRYELKERLPEGMAIQFEVCGGKIQANPMGLKLISGFAFNVFNIQTQRYLEYKALVEFTDWIGFPMCDVVDEGSRFSSLFNMDELANGEYGNGKTHEGVVVRSQRNELGHAPISFKIINLGYGK